MTALTSSTAIDLARSLDRGDISAVEVMQAHLDRIEEVNPAVGAVVSQLPASEALDAARRADAARLRGDDLGPLHGLPTAVKDLMDVAGLPTTNGSAAFAGAAPASADSVLAGRLREAGAIIIGKTNTPEMGQGTLTFNPVFGITRNPWDLSRHAGGSSGGAAAAVAARMLPIADGSDSGGSLRFPAAFCNVVGLRPTPGRIGSGRPGNVWSPHAVLGPMARDSRDAAFLLNAVAGPASVAPLSRLAPDGGLAALEVPDLAGVRIAWSADAGGLPVDPEVAALHAALGDSLALLGAVVEAAEPGFAGACEAWETIETFEFFLSGRALVDEGRRGFREDYHRNIEQGRALTATQLADALEYRTGLFRRTARLLQDYDVLVLPATPVPAPRAGIEWVHEVGDVGFDRYFQWQMLANVATMTAHPVAVTAAGFTGAGLPVGVQVIGRYGADARLLAVCAAIEDATGWITEAPPL